MCKEMPVIPVNRVADKKRIIRKNWRVKEEERHKWSLTPQKWITFDFLITATAFSSALTHCFKCFFSLQGSRYLHLSFLGMSGWRKITTSSTYVDSLPS
jgi:hypothetical protein